MAKVDNSLPYSTGCHANASFYLSPPPLSLIDVEFCANIMIPALPLWTGKVCEGKRGVVCATAVNNTCGEAGPSTEDCTACAGENYESLREDCGTERLQVECPAAGDGDGSYAGSYGGSGYGSGESDAREDEKLTLGDLHESIEKDTGTYPSCQVHNAKLFIHDRSLLPQ
jgi:hypothetical protein